MACMYACAGERSESGLNVERSGVVEGAGSCVVYNPTRSLSMTQQRQRLPIFKVSLQLCDAFSASTSQACCLPCAQLRNHILYLVERHRCLVVVGETGCGKTTQIPQVHHSSR